MPALIGSTLRGAFGHALKAIACSVQHRDCGRCLLSEVCLYPTVFEPTAVALKDLPRPFIFEPPVPPLTREISENSSLKLRVAEKGKIAFDLTLIGESAGKLPYFIYAFELMARHGLGASRQSFAVAEVFSLDSGGGERIPVYTPHAPRILPHRATDLAGLIEKRLSAVSAGENLKLCFKTPLRIRRNRELLERITFAEFFKQCSLRLKFMAENYGEPLEYDYKVLTEKAEGIETVSNDLWRHSFTRRTNRQDKNYDLDGMLGEIEFAGAGLDEFLPFAAAGEILHIGSATSFGLGKFEII